MPPADALWAGDAAAVSRYLQIRALIHDHYLPRVEKLIQSRYVVRPAQGITSTLVSHVRGGFLRPGEGELWPVIFTTMVDISVALCVQLSDERVANLGTMINGPQRIRHRGWEDWWGWERPIGHLHPEFFGLSPELQEDALVHWYLEGCEWLAGSGLLRRRG